jgi:DeoR/GlpR family transcriptional regulator of sugar metabolism
MFDSSAKRILLTDHTKFTRRALHSFAALTEFDAVIVDEATPIEHITRMRGKGINVIIAPAVTARHEAGAD